ncbi:helix-turn-helix domain-containing protein, partial [Dactylosporangium sp. NPDC051485]|uniref:helix-turn-helix transcriptional regulator n=1 Tax=Dactylosporangium sp. NPDC051485 TaxID=3154846 RepID=UPI00343BD8D7
RALAAAGAAAAFVSARFGLAADHAADWLNEARHGHDDPLTHDDPPDPTGQSHGPHDDPHRYDAQPDPTAASTEPAGLHGTRHRHDAPPEPTTAGAELTNARRHDDPPKPTTAGGEPIGPGPGLREAPHRHGTPPEPTTAGAEPIGRSPGLPEMLGLSGEVPGPPGGDAGRPQGERDVCAADEVADAHRMLAAVRWCLGDAAGNRRSLDRAAAAGGSAASRARQRVAEAERVLRTEGPRVALPPAEAAVAAAERAGAGIAGASVTLGTALALTGSHERGVALLRAARQIAGREHDPVAIGRAVHALVAVSLPRLGDVLGWRLFDEAMTTIGRYGLEFCAGRTTSLGVAHAVRVGDLARAEALVWSRLPIEGDPVERVRFIAHAGLLALERGDDPLAVRMLARADAEGRDSGLVRVLRVAVAARGVHPADPAEALRECVGRCGPARLAEAARWALHGGVPAATVEEHVAERPARLRLLLAVFAGRDAEAVALLPEALDDGGQGRGAASGAQGRRMQGQLMHSQGMQSQGIQGRGIHSRGMPEFPLPGDKSDMSWRAAPDMSHEHNAGGRPEDAAVHTAVAHALVRLGRAGEARRHAERAVALLAHWPGWRLAEAETLLHSLRAGGDLTARELEVLGCLAAGMTNQQVASSLGISIRTVAVHVSNLLRKTGAASRTEAALWAVRHRLAPER